MNREESDCLSDNDFTPVNVMIKTEIPDQLESDLVECNSNFFVMKTESEDEFDVSDISKENNLNKCVYNNESNIITKYQLDDGYLDLLDVPNSEIVETEADRQKKSRKHNEQDNKSHICDICNKVFLKERNLILHRKLHNEPKIFECVECTKSFSKKSHLDSHMRMHMGEKPYMCDVCQKTFKRNHHLKDHRLVHTGEKPYPCTSCDKQFSLKSDLSKHERIHKGEKPYVCDICDRAFTRKSILDCHKRVHTEEKLFTCEICSKSYKHSSGLYTHRLKHKE